MSPKEYQSLYTKTLSHLQGKKRILFLTTSNRWGGDQANDIPKSTALAQKLARDLGDKVTVIDVPSLLIHPCEGNISSKDGNMCGLKKAILNDPEKNPSGQHRCRASVNNSDDELWKISKALLESDAVIFFTSVRWGQTNSFYQKLIERLTWLENRHSTLGEDNILKDIDAGIIISGHNRNGMNVIATQKEVLGYYGFNVVDDLCRNRWFTKPEDESNESYLDAHELFEKTFLQ